MAKATFEPAVIAERVDLTDDLAVFRIAPETKLDFIAGQFATLALERDGQMLQRAYSMVSAPREPLLEFFIELVPGGLLSPRLWELKAGDRLLLRNRAAGAFLLDTASGLRRHLMIATVTGVAPFISMIRSYAYEAERGTPSGLAFALLHGASRSRELAYYGEQLSLIARQGWLDYVPTVSRPSEEAGWAGEVGRVDDIIRKHADNLGFRHTNAIAYACGHPVMVENAKAILARARFAKSQIRAEKYFTIKLPK